jgi:hypothetical protein
MGMPGILAERAEGINWDEAGDAVRQEDPLGTQERPFDAYTLEGVKGNQKVGS